MQQFSLCIDMPPQPVRDALVACIRQKFSVVYPDTVLHVTFSDLPREREVKLRAKQMVDGAVEYAWKQYRALDTEHYLYLEFVALPNSEGEKNARGFLFVFIIRDVIPSIDFTEFHKEDDEEDYLEWLTQPFLQAAARYQMERVDAYRAKITATIRELVAASYVLAGEMDVLAKSDHTSRDKLV